MIELMSVPIQSLSHYHRGYGESDKPPKVTDYRMSKLTKDIAELVSNTYRLTHGNRGGMRYYRGG